MDKTKRFRIALAVAGMTQKQWADSQGVTEMAVYSLLRGRMVSSKLTAALETFIAEHLSELRDELNRAA